MSSLTDNPNDQLTATIIKKALKIVDELGKLDSFTFDEDEDALDILEGLIQDANELKKNRLWRL